MAERAYTALENWGFYGVRGWRRAVSMQLLCPVTCGEKPPMKSISLPTPFKYNSQHKCADMAEGAINLIADYLFPAAPGARQRGDVRIAGEEADVTAD